MSIVYKRIFWIGAIVLFLILSTVAVLYGRGYKYNPNTNTIESTGILYIKTYPRDVNIWIDDQLYASHTPWQKNRLLPGEYTLNIEANDYFNWEKRINITAGQSTMIEDVVLFKREMMIALRKFDLLDHISMSNNNQVLLVTENNENKLLVLNQTFENFNDIYTFTTDDTIELISLSPNDKKLIYKNQNSYWLINLEYPAEHYRLSGLNNIYWQDFKWHQNDDDIIYSRIDNSISQIILDKDGAKIETQINNIYGYFPYQDGLIYAEQNDKEMTLTLASTELEKIKDLIYIPFSSGITSDNYGNTLVLNDYSNNKLYYLKIENNEDIIAKIFDNYTNFKWYSKTHDKIAMWNDNEISIYFVNRDESLLLLRTSNNISNVWWHPNGTYIFYQTNDDINLIELDERDKRNNYYFSSREIDAPFIINNQGTAVYSYSHDSQTFYRINIQ